MLTSSLMVPLAIKVCLYCLYYSTPDKRPLLRDALSQWKHVSTTAHSEYEQYTFGSHTPAVSSLALDAKRFLVPLLGYALVSAIAHIGHTDDCCYARHLPKGRHQPELCAAVPVTRL